MQVDINKVVNELTMRIAELTKENAILKVQLTTALNTHEQISKTEKEATK